VTTTEFDPAAFQAALTTRAIGRYLLLRPVADSTMVLARREADEGAPHGTLVMAEEQSAGRGRRGRSFYSPAGSNLYITFVLRLSLHEHQRLPTALPLAVCEAVRSDGVDARIKWPNDIWIGDLKVCGMLIDAELQADGALAMPGIGINVNGDPGANPELAGIATSIERAAGHRIEREPLLARLCNGLDRWLAADAEEVADRYRDLSMILGRQVSVHPSAAEAYEGMAEGVRDDGALIVRRADGTVESLLAGDVTVRPAAGR
jgi:BirA family biotin operon repressor/biotin-[acetyl-CoA-carboxylase] ligase